VSTIQTSDITFLHFILKNIMITIQEFTYSFTQSLINIYLLFDKKKNILNISLDSMCLILVFNVHMISKIKEYYLYKIIQQIICYIFINIVALYL
jgi:hypothetical protein